jgi:hypothetical protein
VEARVIRTALEIVQQAKRIEPADVDCGQHYELRDSTIERGVECVTETCRKIPCARIDMVQSTNCRRQSQVRRTLLIE